MPAEFLDLYGRTWTIDIDFAADLPRGLAVMQRMQNDAHLLRYTAWLCCEQQAQTWNVSEAEFQAAFLPVQAWQAFVDLYGASTERPTMEQADEQAQQAIEPAPEPEVIEASQAHATAPASVDLRGIGGVDLKGVPTRELTPDELEAMLPKGKTIWFTEIKGQ